MSAVTGSPRKRPGRLVGRLPTVCPPPIPSGCVLYFDMQDPGTRSWDKSGSNNHGVFTGTSMQTGPNGPVRYFDGASRIDVSDRATLNMGTAQDFVLAVWLKPTITAAVQQVLDKRATVGGATLVGYTIYYAATSGALVGYIKDSPGATAVTVVGGNLTNGKWQMAVATFDRSGNASLYINRSPTGTALSIAAVGDCDNAGGLKVGCNPSSGSNMTGSVGEVWIVRDLWSAADVKRWYETTAWRYGVA